MMEMKNKHSPWFNFVSNLIGSDCQIKFFINIKSNTVVSCSKSKVILTEKLN